jgi:hypothetical protein
VEEMTYLTGDGECMTNLRFTRSEFTYPSAFEPITWQIKLTEQFSDSTSLDPTP